MMIFLDTNILVQILNNPKNALPSNATYCTFLKNIYEYKYKLKKYLSDAAFIFNCLKSTAPQSVSNDILQTKAQDIIWRAFNNTPHSDKNALSNELKKINCKFQLTLASEWIYEDDTEFIQKAMKYMQDFDHHDPMIQLPLFFKKTYILMNQYLREIDLEIKNRGIVVISYQQVFSNDANGYSLQEFIDNAQIPASDLEIVLAAISTNCKLFLSCDKDLIKSCVSLGLGHTTAFRLCNNDSVFDDILTAILSLS